MKIKKIKLIKHLIQCAQLENSYALEKDKENNLYFFAQINGIAELFNETVMGKRIVIYNTDCDGFSVACGIDIDGERIFDISEKMTRLICNEISDNSPRKEIINEVSQFLQGAGFDDASKAVDREYEL